MAPQTYTHPQTGETIAIETDAKAPAVTTVKSEGVVAEVKNELGKIESDIKKDVSEGEVKTLEQEAEHVIEEVEGEIKKLETEAVSGLKKFFNKKA